MKFEEIDVIDNTVNQSIITSFYSYLHSFPLSSLQLNSIVSSFLNNEHLFDPHIYAGFILQFVGTAAFRKSPKYKDLFEALLTLVDKKNNLNTSENTHLFSQSNEEDFALYLKELSLSYALCTVTSLDDLIVNNMIDLANEKKYYDSAKINYKY